MTPTHDRDGAGGRSVGRWRAAWALIAILVIGGAVLAILLTSSNRPVLDAVR